ncbi:MAG: DUF362 domain-containing protein [Desulfobulbus sp.]|nr:DUF362 domain-containing protein [Desulfobulbus sp.]
MQCLDTRVALCAQPCYGGHSFETIIVRLLSCEFFADKCRSSSILLKPNLITATNGRLACTNRQVILAVARFFIELGARVAVGDSPAFGTARSVLRKIGILSELEHLGVRIAEFGQHLPVDLPSGQRARIARPVMECDYLINLPKVKAHSQMRLTLAVKNYFGCISGLHKPWWHMVHGGPQGHFAHLLVELLSVLPSGYSLVDGVEAMHGTGPIHGERYSLGLLAGGINPVAVDTGLLAILGVDPQTCPLWVAARGVGLRGTGAEELFFTHDDPTTLNAEGFLVLDELIPVRFNPLRFVKSSIQRVIDSRNR